VNRTIKAALLKTEGKTEVKMHKYYAEILSCTVRDGAIHLHYIEPADRDEDEYGAKTFEVLQNGAKIDRDHDHIATLTMNIYTWHVFQVFGV